MIEVELGSVKITLGLDNTGEQIYNVALNGDITYIQAMGLLTAAQRDIPNIYEQNTWQEDD